MIAIHPHESSQALSVLSFGLLALAAFWSKASARRLVVATGVAVALSAAMVYAAPKPTIVISDPCSHPPISELPVWEQILLGCW